MILLIAAALMGAALIPSAPAQHRAGDYELAVRSQSPDRTELIFEMKDFSMETIEITGGCYCGAVRYRATCEPEHSTICHCANCRRAGGAQSVAWLTFPLDHFAFVEGEPVSYRTDTQATRTFCGRCGTPLTYQNDSRPDDIDVTTGSADDPEAYPPTRDVWEEEKLSWV